MVSTQVYLRHLAFWQCARLLVASIPWIQGTNDGVELCPMLTGPSLPLIARGGGWPQVHRGVLKKTGQAIAVKIVELPNRNSSEYDDIVRPSHSHSLANTANPSFQPTLTRVQAF